jgi:hypothetical protein
MEHNFAASTDDRSSVMDYPFPLVRLDPENGLDFSDAYTSGIGPWDKRTVLYAYQDFPAGADEAAQRRNILDQTIASGLRYVSDEDSRDPGTANPLGNLWDNGADAIAELARLLQVRAYALDHFSENNIRPGRPLATLEEVLVPVYLLHRYQVQAVAKLIGGQYFSYTIRGDGQAAPVRVDTRKQQDAIAALAGTLDPGVLMLPKTIVDIIPPRPPGLPLDRESFSRSTGVTFDPLSPAASAVSLTLEVLLDKQRAARLNVQHMTDPSQPDFAAILKALGQASWYAQRREAAAGALQRQTSEQYLNRLMALATDENAHFQVRAQAFLALQELAQWLERQSSLRLDTDWNAFYAQSSHAISAMMNDPARVKPVPAPKPPPGSPIGN